MGFVFAEHSDAFLKGEIRVTRFMVHPAYPPQYYPVPYYFFPGKENAVTRIVHMSRLRTRAVHFNDTERFSSFKFLPGIKPDIEPAIIKIFYLLTDTVNGFI